MAAASGRSVALAGIPWPSVPDAPVLLVPVGSTEQHGPHLPFAADALVAAAVAEGLAERLGGCVVAPALAFGASGEHQGFPGTMSMGIEALRVVLVELGRSASAWARRTVFVNGHGGNLAALDAAVALLTEEGRDACWVPCAAPGADAHAGRTETSLLLHLAPEVVLLDRAEAGETRPVRALLPDLRRVGVRAVSPNGVLGDPAGATAEEGRRLLAAMVETAAALL